MLLNTVNRGDEMINIRKNVPIPNPDANEHRYKHRDLYDLVERWEVGDSAVIEERMERDKHGAWKNTRYSTLQRLAKGKGQKVHFYRNLVEGRLEAWRVR